MDYDASSSAALICFPCSPQSMLHATILPYIYLCLNVQFHSPMLCILVAVLVGHECALRCCMTETASLLPFLLLVDEHLVVFGQFGNGW